MHPAVSGVDVWKVGSEYFVQETALLILMFFLFFFKKVNTATMWCSWEAFLTTSFGSQERVTLHTFPFLFIQGSSSICLTVWLKGWSYNLWLVTTAVFTLYSCSTNHSFPWWISWVTKDIPQGTSTPHHIYSFLSFTDYSVQSGHLNQWSLITGILSWIRSHHLH